MKISIGVECCPRHCLKVQGRDYMGRERGIAMFQVQQRRPP
jgi:hypothetical protein